MFKCKVCGFNKLFHFGRGITGWRLHLLGLVVSCIQGRYGGWYIQHKCIYRPALGWLPYHRGHHSERSKP